MNRWVEWNPNPKEKRVGDCSIRACCKATGKTWNEVFREMAEIAYRQKDVLSANSVWGEYLEKNGYTRREMPGAAWRQNIIDFCEMHPEGCYVLGLEGHVVTVVDGMYYDTWDSGHKEPLYFWEK